MCKTFDKWKKVNKASVPTLSLCVCLDVCVSVFVCDGVHVTVPEKQQLAMLFQAVVLPCHYQTSSRQTPVVQWWYKSYCRDRTRDSFTLPETLGRTASELGATAHLECSDNSRTVRVVASLLGASLTLAEHYKGRDISIINSNCLVLAFFIKTRDVRSDCCCFSTTHAF